MIQIKRSSSLKSLIRGSLEEIRTSAIVTEADKRQVIQNDGYGRGVVRE